jgi:hypothetical protein
MRGLVFKLRGGGKGIGQGDNVDAKDTGCMYGVEGVCIRQLAVLESRQQGGKRRLSKPKNEM